MKRFDPRLWLGILLVFGGVLSLLGSLNIISDVGDIFWGILWGAVGLFFLYMLYRDRANWWAAFPGFTLLGLALSNFLPDSLEAFDGLVFFAGISLAFWWVYFTDTSRWWAIIPGGVLLTLGATSVMDELSGIDSGGFFFLGLGLTFILVAILPGGGGRSWAFIPGVILLIFGSIIGSPAVGLLEYVWPAVLIVLGGYFVFRFFRNQSTP
ncbi:MAG TPA: hypothetical protein VMJ90_03955 [Anaerolineales bacterium]|nr:hypothetical protein [Anaerolineales bacterium]